MLHDLAIVALLCPHVFTSQLLVLLFVNVSILIPINPLLFSMHLTPHLSVLHRLPWPPVGDCTVSMAVL